MSFFKILLPLGFLTLVLIAILVLPVDRSLLFQGDASDRWLNLTVVLSGLYLLWLISSRFPKWIGNSDLRSSGPDHHAHQITELRPGGFQWARISVRSFLFILNLSRFA